MVAVKQGTFQSLEETRNAAHGNIMTIRIKYRTEMLRLVIVHAPQETDDVEERTEFYEEVAVQVQGAENVDDRLVVVGDFNARIDENSISEPNSPNGRLLQELIAENQLQVANHNARTTGVWTRIQKKKDGTDYVLMKDEMLSIMSEMLIDEEKIYCPYRQRITKKKRVKKITFSDHCAIIFKMKIQRNNTSHKETSYKTWNYTEEGYAAYKIESSVPMDVKWSSDSTQAYTFWTEKFEELLARCFTKKTMKIGTQGKQPASNGKNKGIRDILSTVAKRGKVQRNIVKTYKERLIELEARQQAIRKIQKMKRTMADLTEEERFSPNGYWRLKKAADKALKTEVPYTILKDNGIEVSGDQSIKDAYREEFQYRLRTREPHEGWREYVDEVNTVVWRWLDSEDPTTSCPFTEEELDAVIGRLKKGKSPGLDDYPP